MTRKQLERFVKIRNASGFSSNLQFQFDLESVGLKIADLGPVEVFEATATAPKAYVWTTPHGRLREMGGRLELEVEGA